MTTAVVDIAYQLQHGADRARSTADLTQAQAVRSFQLWMKDLTNDELRGLSDNCGEEGSDDHCVYCAAWYELVRRGDEDA